MKANGKFRNRLLVVIQIAALLLTGAILVEGTLWALWTNSRPTLIIVLSVLSGYLAFLSASLFGNREAWARRAFRKVWQATLAKLPRAVATVALLVGIAGMLGWEAHEAWHSWLILIITSNNESVSEPVALHIQTSERDLKLSAEHSRAKVKLTRGESAEQILVSAESDSYHTADWVEAKAGTVRIPLVRRRSDLPIRWELVTDRSSLSYEKKGVDMSIFPNPELTWIVRNGDGDPDADPQYYLRILRWLRNRVRSLELYQYEPILLRDDINLIELTFEKPRFIRAVMPTLAEYNMLEGDERDVANRWLVNYVGQWNPRIRFTIDNSGGEQNVQVISLIYDVEETTVFAGVIPFPEFPEYTFDLAFKEGIQKFPLSRQHGEIAVPAGQASAFDIVFRPGEDAADLSGWTGIVSLETSRGVFTVGRLTLQTYNAQKGGVKAKGQ